MRKIIAALPLAGLLMLPVACGSGRPAWCGQAITAQVGFSGAPTQTIPVDGQDASSLAQDVLGAETAGEIAGGGYLSEVLTVPADFPAAIRRYAASFNRSRNDAIKLMGIGAVWNADYQAQCR